MTTIESFTSSSSPDNGKDNVNLWLEWGFSRREIAPRMKSASQRLNIFSTPRQPINDTEAIDLPSLDTPEGIDQVNAIIQDRGIDALWVQESAKYDLSGIETEVHAAAYPSTIELVDDKIAFAEWLGDDPYRPFTVEAVGADAIHNEYLRRNGEGHEVCIKPVVGVNGEGYWRLSETQPPLLLNNPERRTIHPDVYLKAMEHQEATKGAQRMIMMDYLPGPEVSVDLLTWEGTPLIHAARTKSGDTQRIQSEHEVLEHGYDIASRLGFHGIISLQYRLDADKNWKILEINPRPAGGSTNSEDAGFGIITDWAKLVAGEIGPNDVKQRHGDVTFAKRYYSELQSNEA